MPLRRGVGGVKTVPLTELKKKKLFYPTKFKLGGLFRSGSSSIIHFFQWKCVFLRWRRPACSWWECSRCSSTYNNKNICPTLFLLKIMNYCKIRNFMFDNPPILDLAGEEGIPRIILFSKYTFQERCSFIRECLYFC